MHRVAAPSLRAPDQMREDSTPGSLGDGANRRVGRVNAADLCRGGLPTKANDRCAPSKGVTEQRAAQTTQGRDGANEPRYFPSR